MALQFGMARLRGYRNAQETGLAVTTSVANTGMTIATGQVWLDGILCELASQTVTLGATLSGTGKWLIATLPAGNTSTAAATATFTDPTGTLHAVLARFSYGTAPNAVTLAAQEATLANSATTALITFGRAQNVTVNITYDQAVARGGTLIFANDAKFFNGAIEGNMEYANIEAEGWAKMMGGTYASGGASSGTWSVSGTNKPFPFMIEAYDLTDGVTSVVRILKCYSTQLALKFSIENYLIPNVNFVAVANQVGNIISINA